MANNKHIEEDVLENKVVEEITEDTIDKEVDNIEEPLDEEADEVEETVEDASIEAPEIVEGEIEDKVKEDSEVEEDIAETSIIEDNISDSSESEEIISNEESTIKVGGYVPFKGISARLYPTCVSKSYTEFVPDGAYIWSGDICNGRIRVCKSSDMKSLSGWVNISDLGVSK